MPILPAMAAVCGIISCFQSAGSLFTAVKSRKEASKRHHEGVKQREEDKAAEARKSEEAHKSLIVGPKHVQREYDRDFALMGDAFARGDDTGRMQLMTELITLQKTVITVLQNALTTNHLDLSQLAMASTARRAGAVNALQNQFQRMSVAAPIPKQQLRLPRPTRPRLCNEAERLLHVPNATPRFEDHPTPHPTVPGRYGQRCRGCDSTWDIQPVGLLRDKVSGMQYPSDFQYRCHSNFKDLYLCFLCGAEDGSPVLEGFADLMEHMRSHSQAELLRCAASRGWVEPHSVESSVAGDYFGEHACEHIVTNGGHSRHGSERGGYFDDHVGKWRDNIIVSASGTPRGSPRASPRASPRDTPMATPRGTPMATPKGSPMLTPMATSREMPWSPPRGTPVVTPGGIPLPTPRGTPWATPVATPLATPTGTPKATPATSPNGSPNTNFLAPPSIKIQGRPGLNRSVSGVPCGTPQSNDNVKSSHSRSRSEHSSVTEGTPMSTWSDWGARSNRSSVSSVSSVMSRASVMGKPPVGKNLELYVNNPD